MSESNLAKNTLIYAIGNIGVLIINFVLVPFYTFFLTKEELGYYDFIVTTAMFIAPFATLQVEMAILRWLLDNDSKNIKKSVITNSFFILSINLLLLTALFFAFSKYFIDKYNIIILFYYVLFFLYPLFKQILRGIGKPKQYIFVEICYTSLFLILSILFIVHFKLGVKGLLISNIIALSFSILFVFFNNKIYNYIGKQYFSKSLLIQMLKYSVPMILNISSVWFMTSAIKYFIIYFNGYASNGIYTVAYKFSSIIQIFNTIFYLSWQEEAIKNYRKNNFQESYNRIFEQYIIFMSSLLISITGIAPLVLKFVIGENFHEAVQYVPILSLGFVFMSLGSFYGVIYQCEKNNIGLSLSAIISGLFLVLFSFIFKSIYNIQIASFIFIFSFIVFFLYRFFDTRRFLIVKFPLKKVLPFILLYVILFIANQHLEFKAKIFFNAFILLIYLTVYRMDIILMIKWFNILQYVKRG